MLCYRCGSHVADGSEACASCGQRFDTGLRGKAGQYRRRPLDLEAGGIKPGDLLAGRYEVRGVLGSGPLGVVFRALDRQVDVEVALKVIAPNLIQSVEERADFLKSLKQAKKLNHPNLVRIYDVGQVEASAEQPARAFFTSQLLEGMTLRRAIELRREKGQFFNLREAEPILAQIAHALDQAHQLGPHGDLKPENVIVLPDLLKVVDFGVGPAIPRAPFLAAQRQRKADVYMSPEVLGGRVFDRRADVFSLGVILGELLSGVVPVPNSAPPPLRERQRDLPPAVEGLYRKALGSEASSRFASAGDLAHELLGLAELASRPRPPPLRAGSEQAGPRSRTPPPPPPGSIASSVRASAAAPAEESTTLDQDAPTPQVDLPAELRELEQSLRPRPSGPGSLPPPPVSSQGDGDAWERAGETGRVARPLLPEGSSATEPLSGTGTAIRSRPAGRSGQRRTAWPLVLLASALLIASAWLGGRWYRTLERTSERNPEASGRRSEREPGHGLVGPQASPDLGAAADAGRRVPQIGAVASSTDADAGRSPPALPVVAGEPAAVPVAGEDGGQPVPIALAGALPRIEPIQRSPTEEPVHPHRELRVAQTDPAADPDSRWREADPEPLAGEPAPARAGGCPAGMQLVAGGGFHLGTPASDDLGNFGDRPERKASVRTFCIDQYEYPNQPTARPTTAITASSAEASCRRDGKRLCAEEEWEKACKGPGNHRFPYGEAFNESACRSRGGVGLAGALSDCRSGYGVFDLSGNVAEWTASRFQPSTSDRAVKGGAVESPDYDLRCSARANRAPGTRSGTLGFRCCSDAR